MDQLLLRVDEAAALLRISRSTAYNMIAAGTIPSVRVGQRLRVPFEALKDSIAKLSVGDKSRSIRPANRAGVTEAGQPLTDLQVLLRK